jgi:hypothetical protein
LPDSAPVAQKSIVWLGKPYVAPAAIIRTVTLIVLTSIFLSLEIIFGDAYLNLGGLAVLVWTIIIFTLIWLISLLDIYIFYWSNTYILRQDGLEIKHGIVRLHSFVVTPSGFGDLAVYQSVGGRIFGYGNITVNSQGERETRLLMVRGPFKVADSMRDIMGKPIVRVEGRI